MADLYLGKKRRQRRRQFWFGVAKWLLALSIITAPGLFAYETGSVMAERQVLNLRQDVSKREETIGDLRRRNGELEAALEASNAEVERYRNEAPSGATKELLDLVRQRLAAGVEASRLSFVIGAAKNERDCDETPVTRRFIVPTPIYNGANDSVRFADNAITVTASGQSAVDAEGRREAWFDPAQPVTLHFARLGGDTSEVTGVLPLHHSVVIGDTEHRFSVFAEGRGFVKVAGDRCRYP